MYGPSSKFGGAGRGGPSTRGGSAVAGGPKRFPPQPLNRHPTTAPPRLSSSNPRSSSSNNKNNRSGATSSSGGGGGGGEETFSLIQGKTAPAFAMIIKLAPDLVEEIKRVEAQGGLARVKFDSVGSNPDGNVIDVGGKQFKFKWSREFGDLCDIYEECESGEDGNGLLVETGCAWRKLNVQRILDESTTNHVKRLSEEAERKHKSRKAIILDHGNPSMKNQIKQMQAAEANPWRMGFKHKKEPPFKKARIEPSTQVVAARRSSSPLPSKSTFKSGLASTPSVKGTRSSSPLLLSSPPEQSGAPSSPFGTGGMIKTHANTEEITPPQKKSKDNAGLQKDIHRNASSIQEASEYRSAAKQIDVQRMLIALLVEHPQGMSLKDVKKSIEEISPNAPKNIEPILKQIAIFKHPGKYVLKPGVDVGSIKKPSSESGSSPEDSYKQTLLPDDIHDPRLASGPKFSEQKPEGEMEKHNQIKSKQLEETNELEKVNFCITGEKPTSGQSEEKAGSSSDSGSDSDSDSSGSGSDSGSHSRSPVGSRSGTSSDSESDASSNSKEGSDEDVDIMSSDDVKDPHDISRASEPDFLATADPWAAQNELVEKQDGDEDDAIDIEGHGSDEFYEGRPGSDAVDIEGDKSDEIDNEGHGFTTEGHESDTVDIENDVSDDERETDGLLAQKAGGRPTEGAKTFTFTPDIIQDRETVIGNLFGENMVSDSFGNEHFDSTERVSKGSVKRDADVKHREDGSNRSKKFKADSLSQRANSGGWDARKSDSSKSRHSGDKTKGIAADKEGNTDSASQKGQNPSYPGNHGSDSHDPGRRSSDPNPWAKPPDISRRSKLTEELDHGKGAHVHEGSDQREKASRDSLDNSTKDRKGKQNHIDGGAGGRYPGTFDSLPRKQGEISGKIKILNSKKGSPPKDNDRVDAEKYPRISGRGLQRELSDLELGELREPLPEETQLKKQLDRKGSFKQSTPDSFNSDLKGKTTGVTTAQAERTPEHCAEDLPRSQTRAVPSQAERLSRPDNADRSSSLRQNEAGTKLGSSTESNGENTKNAPANAHRNHDLKNGSISNPMKDGKIQTANAMASMINGRKDLSVEGINHAQKRRESSSEEDSSSYSKYEKAVPELKGPIQDFSQYKEYVQEYRDKYDSYCSLNKILENYRNEFQKLGEDLESAKVRDMDRYHKILVQLKESYQECGAKHKRLKKIFIVLHEELKNLKQRIKDFALSHS